MKSIIICINNPPDCTISFHKEPCLKCTKFSSSFSVIEFTKRENIKISGHSFTRNNTKNNFTQECMTESRSADLSSLCINLLENSLEQSVRNKSGFICTPHTTSVQNNFITLRMCLKEQKSAIYIYSSPVSITQLKFSQITNTTRLTRNDSVSTCKMRSSF